MAKVGIGCLGLNMFVAGNRYNFRNWLDPRVKGKNVSFEWGLKELMISGNFIVLGEYLAADGNRRCERSQKNDGVSCLEALTECLKEKRGKYFTAE